MAKLNPALDNIMDDFNKNLDKPGKELINKVFYPLANYYETNLLPDTVINGMGKDEYYKLLQELQTSLERDNSKDIEKAFKGFQNWKKEYFS